MTTTISNKAPAGLGDIADLDPQGPDFLSVLTNQIGWALYSGDGLHDIHDPQGPADAHGVRRSTVQVNDHEHQIAKRVATAVAQLWPTPVVPAVTAEHRRDAAIMVNEHQARWPLDHREFTERADVIARFIATGEVAGPNPMIELLVKIRKVLDDGPRAVGGPDADTDLQAIHELLEAAGIHEGAAG